MKIISKKDVIRLAIIAAMVIILIWILDPTPLVKWRVENNAKSLYLPKYKKDYSLQFKTFFDMGKLIDRGNHEFSRSVLDSVYSHKSDDYRLDGNGLDILLDIKANVLRSLPMNSVLVTENIDDMHPFAFVQISENIRPDVILLNRAMWKNKKYRKFIWENSAIEDIFTKDEFIEGNDNFDKILHKLARKFPIFFTCRICNITEFPKDSLYKMPIVGYIYMARSVSDSLLAQLKYTMLYSQNWNLVAEHPPLDDKQKYYNTESSELASILSDVTDCLIKTGQDSLAQNILNKFDGWMTWDPFYLIMRADIARKLHDDPNYWLGKAKSWLDENGNHWAYATVLAYYDSAKSVMDKITTPKNPEKTESKPARK